MAKLSLPVTLCENVVSNMYSRVGWMFHSPHSAHVKHTALNRLHVSTGAPTHKPVGLACIVKKLSLTPMELKTCSKYHTHTQVPTDYMSARFQDTST